MLSIYLSNTKTFNLNKYTKNFTHITKRKLISLFVRIKIQEYEPREGYEGRRGRIRRRNLSYLYDNPEA